jgi:hypothetical protein
MITAPSFIAARIVSHSSTRLPSITIIPVAARHAVLAQPVRHLVRAGRQLGERARPLAAVLLDDPQRPAPAALGGQHVEPVQRPVERVYPRPAELAVRTVVVLAGLEQEVACGAQAVGRGPGVERSLGHLVPPNRRMVAGLGGDTPIPA